MTMARLLLTTVLALLVFNACDDEGGGGDDTTATVVATTTPASTATPAATPPTSIGIPEVDAVIDAVLSGDTAALRDLIRFSPVPCRTTSDVGGPPPCRPGEADGTEVDVLPIGTCEGEYRRQDDIDSMLELLDDMSGLFAVYHGAPESRPPGDYALVFARAFEGEELGVELTVDDGDVVYLKFACGETPAQLADVLGLTEQVLPITPTP